MQPFPILNGQQRFYRNAYPYINPYPPNQYPTNYQPGIQYGMNIPYAAPYPSQPPMGFLPQKQHKNSAFLFQNPLQSEEDYQYNNQPIPYTKKHAQLQPAKPATPFNSIFQSFKSQDGSYDFNKMVSTAGQLFNAINQVSGMAKGIGGMFKL
ncbi:YppG family protein [Lederbergia ruris]|uniref:YppG family protein n=1 Tax=Lederbergia ruris TaxID=217495 RepID=UPI00130ECC3F